VPTSISKGEGARQEEKGGGKTTAGQGSQRIRRCGDDKGGGPTTSMPSERNLPPRAFEGREGGEEGGGSSICMPWAEREKRNS